MKPASNGKARDPGFDGLSLPERFRHVLRGSVLYLQARHRLFSIEALEAGSLLSRRLILAILGILAVLFGYGSLLVGGIATLSLVTGWPWHILCLLAAPVHLLMGYGLVCLARRPPAEPLFQESINELTKDREWLSDQKNPWS